MEETGLECSGGYRSIFIARWIEEKQDEVCLICADEVSRSSVPPGSSGVARDSIELARKMTGYTALLESALDCLPDGAAIFDNDGVVAFWSAAAEGVTGYALADFESGMLPSGLSQLLNEAARLRGPRLVDAGNGQRGWQIRTRHKLGHEVPVIARNQLLHDEAGEPIGIVVLFHPAERLDALPHGEANDDQTLEKSHAEFEDRLQAEYENFEQGGEPLGVLWVSVDQGHNLRKTHGGAACHSMIEKVQHTLSGGLRPTEELARWGEDEFLILSHERTPEMLARHASTLAGLARTTDFRWWGDRVSLTVSIGAAQADRRQRLHRLLENARKAMETSVRTGGNRVTCAVVEGEGVQPEEEPLCSPS